MKTKTGKFLAIILTVTMLFATLPLATFTVSAASVDPGDLVASIAESYLEKTQSQMGFNSGWCDLFIIRCAAEAGQSRAIPNKPVVVNLYNAIINAGGNTTSSPVRGDIAFYKTSNGNFAHCAIVTNSNKTTVHGNVTWCTSKGKDEGVSHVCTRAVGVYENAMGQTAVYVHPNYQPTHTHSYGNWQTVTAATCTTAGSKKRVCACGDTQTETIPALGHVEVIDAAIEPTCTETGLTAGKHCSRCGEIITAQETVPALEHDYYASIVLEPTTTQEGYIIYICSRCENSYTEHKDPTDGFYTYKIENNCITITGLVDSNFCGDIDIPSAIIGYPVTSIDNRAFFNYSGIESVKIPNTVTTIGHMAFVGCSGIKSVTIGGLVTSIGNWAFAYCVELDSISIPYSVTSIGSKAFAKCEKLSDVYYAGNEQQKEKIEIGSSNEYLLNATWHYSTLEICEHEITEIRNVAAPTCTTIGYTGDTYCTDCGEKISDGQIIPAKGHTASNWIVDKEAQPGVAGEKHKECTVCHTVLETESIPALQIIDENAPQVIVENKKATAGKTVEVKISLKNNPGIASMKLQLDFGSELTLTNVVFNDAIGGNFQQPQNYNNPVFLNWYDGAKNANGDFLFATLTFKVDDNAAIGEKSIMITYDPEDVYNIAEQNIDFAVTGGKIDIVEYTPGDINGDLAVNNKDLTRLFQYLSGWDVTVNVAALDINGDGNSNNKDLTRLFQYLSGWDVQIF